MHDIQSFLQAAKTISLTKDESDAVRQQLCASMKNVPVSPPLLEKREQSSIRESLAVFTQKYSIGGFSPFSEIAPISPWTGSNLFSYLQPFTIG